MSKVGPKNTTEIGSGVTKKKAPKGCPGLVGNGHWGPGEAWQAPDSTRIPERLDGECGLFLA